MKKTLSFIKVDIARLNTLKFDSELWNIINELSVREKAKKFIKRVSPSHFPWGILHLGEHASLKLLKIGRLYLSLFSSLLPWQIAGIISLLRTINVVNLGYMRFAVILSPCKRYRIRFSAISRIVQFQYMVPRRPSKQT